MVSDTNPIFDVISAFSPDKIILYTDSKSIIEDLCETIDDANIIIATSKPPMSSQLHRWNVKLRKTQHPPPLGLDVLDNAEDLILRFFSEGLLNTSDTVVLVIGTNVQSVMCFEMSRIGVASLRDLIEDRVDLNVIEAVFKLGTVVIREGKEGTPAGALFIIGDTNRVIRQTREVVRNPLEGCHVGEFNIKDKDNWNTLKEYSMMDGAMLLDEHGNPIAAGRYVLFDGDGKYMVDEGLGGRHLAAAAISVYTRAISMAVSSEGTIRVYKDGKKVFKYAGV
ncbi:MAG: DNA integrity scanning protein DisA nucleotide-binding domain protein [Thermoplasmata archaeon]